MANLLQNTEKHSATPFSEHRVIRSRDMGERPPGRLPEPSQASQKRFSINNALGWILQGGVITSSAMICFGCLLFFVHPGDGSSQPVARFPHTLAEVWHGLPLFAPQAYIVLGLLLLLATPVLRVTASILAFAREQDLRYVAITSLVLLVLCLSFLLGKGA